MRARWVFATVLAASLFALIRTQSYFGSVYRGKDTRFYFSMARSLLFDRDLDLTNDVTAVPAGRVFDPDGDGVWNNVPRRPDGGIASKYPIGMSLIELPLLAIGHGARLALETAGIAVEGKDGFSTIELWTVAIGLQLAFACALAALYQLLVEAYGQAAAAVGTIGCWIGTSLFYYSASFVFMSHAMSFALLVGVLLVSRALWSEGASHRTLALAGLCLAGLFLVRPQQAIVAAFLLPLVARGVRGRPPRQWIGGAAVGAVLLLGALGLELFVKHAQFEVWTLNGYALNGEGFTWSTPQLGAILWSASRGLLVFSPVVAIAALAYVVLPRSIAGYVWPSAANALVQVYLIAAWSSPGQGASFGARMWSDNAAVAAIGLTALARSLPAFGGGVLAVAVAACVTWTTYLLARFIGLVG